jgi:hypothetical protein
MKNDLTEWHIASISPPVMETYQGWRPCVDWCTTQIGNPLQDWMYVGEGVFEFREEKMLTAFLLKWA